MDYLLNFSAFADVFAVPGDVVDKYMNEASPDDLKVLLYLLRHRPGGVSDGEMSGFLGLTAEKIRKSVAYWAQKRLFVQDETACAAAPRSTEQTDRPAPVQAPPCYSAEEIESIARQCPDLKFLFSEAPQRLGRLLTMSDCSALVYLFSGAGLPADVILMLIEYCVSIRRGSIHYIQKTGLGWADEGISTHELAERKIRSLEERRSFEGRVRTIMGLGSRAFTTHEQAHLARWHSEFHVSEELVALAYDICVDRLGKISFAYMNSILKSWTEKGIKRPEQAKKDASERKSPAPPSFDAGEYERISIKRLQK